MHHCYIAVCPKGDDPWTVGQNNREINLRINSPNNSTLSGQLGIEFYGITSYISLTNTSNSSCEENLQLSSQIGTVSCNYTIISPWEYLLGMAFLTWPTYVPDNNIFINNGNPLIDDFYCDVSLTNTGNLTECHFSDVVNENIKGKRYVNI